MPKHEDDASGTAESFRLFELDLDAIAAFEDGSTFWWSSFEKTWRPTKSRRLMSDAFVWGVPLTQDAFSRLFPRAPLPPG